MTGLGALPSSDGSAFVRVFASAMLEGRSPVELPSMAGEVEVGEGAVTFQSRFGFVPGASYAVLVQRREEDRPLTFTLERGAAEESAGSTRVIGLYPTARSVPFNLLRMYVVFSSPMSEGQVDASIHVCEEASGLELSDVLLTMKPELWDRARTRLTLLFDPGRIKQGLLPHQEIGYPLAAGQAVKVVIDATFLDSAGQSLQQSFERHYQVSADVREHVDPSAWTIHPPKLGTLEPLIIDFDRPLDFGLLHHSIQVHADAGEPIAGTVAIGREERSWALVPVQAWRAGPYRLEINSRLEDLAGNSLRRVFDRDLGRADHNPRSEAEAALTFEIVAS